MTTLHLLEWSGTLLGITGGILISLKTRYTKYGPLLFLASCIPWSVFAYLQAAWGMLLTQGVFVVIDMVGVYRWLLMDADLVTDSSGTIDCTGQASL